MNPLWSYFWPVFACGLVLGAAGGLIAMRGRKAWMLAPAAALALAAAAAWHWPLGAADRYASTIERWTEQTLVYYEMTSVEARLQQEPLTRRILLSGEADEFQREELARLLGSIRGVSSASWSEGAFLLPLIGEAALTALAGFLLGLLLAYVRELRRRYNAQWSW